MLTDAESAHLNELIENEEAYLKVAKKEDFLYKLEPAYKELISAQNTYIRALTLEVVSRTGYANALSQRKVDPSLVGGAVQAVGGIGAGIYAAGSSANRNARIDEYREKYREQVSQNVSKVCDASTNLIRIMHQVDRLLEPSPGIRTYLEEKKMKTYQECEKELREYQYQNISVFKLINSCNDIMLNPNFAKMQALNEKFREFGDFENSKEYAEKSANICEKIRKHTLRKGWALSACLAVIATPVFCWIFLFDNFLPFLIGFIVIGWIVIIWKFILH